MVQKIGYHMWMAPDAIWLLAQKDNGGYQTRFFPFFWLLKKTKVHYFQNHVLPLPFLSSCIIICKVLILNFILTWAKYKSCIKHCKSTKTWKHYASTAKPYVRMTSRNKKQNEGALSYSTWYANPKYCSANNKWIFL